MTIRKRLVASELRNLRKTAGLTQEDVARELRFSRQTLYRIESGKGATRFSDISALLTLYNAPDDVRAKLELAAKRSAEHGWWADEPYSGAVSDHLAFYFSLEDMAQDIRRWTTSGIYGLLQTYAFARAIEAQVTTPSALIDRRAELRMQRQRRVWSPDRDDQRVWVVMDEAVLRRVVGSRQIMVEQLRHLIELAEHERGRLTLQILPFESYVPASAAEFTLFTFANDEDGVGAGDGTFGISFFDRSAQIEHLNHLFGGLSRSALSPQASVARIAEIAKEHENARSESH